MDLLPDGRVEFSAQILVPAAVGSDGGSKSAKTIVRTGVGANVFDAMHDLQEQVSRDAFVGHRVALLISERMAKHGIQPYVDEIERNPESNLRVQAFVIRGKSSKEFLELPAPLEGYTTKAVKQMAQFSDIDERVGVLHSFVNTALSDGMRPILQVIDLKPHPAGERRSGNSRAPSQDAFKMSGIALFNRRDQVVGYLDGNEADEAAWVAGLLRKAVLTTYMEKAHGTVSLELAKIHRRIHSEIHGRRITVYVTLSGDGIIRENNSTLNMFLPQDIEYARQVFNRSTMEQVQQVITKVQKDYSTDIFGFGENIHRYHPYAWRTLRHQWDSQFPLVRTVVDVDLHVQLFGNMGPSSLVPEGQR